MSNPTHHVKVREKGKKTWAFYSGGKSGGSLNHLRIHARQFTEAQANDFIEQVKGDNQLFEFKAVLIRKGPAPSGPAAVKRFNGFHKWATARGFTHSEPFVGDALSVHQGTPYVVQYVRPAGFSWPDIEAKLAGLKAPFRHLIHKGRDTVAVIYPGDPYRDHSPQSAADFDSGMYGLLAFLFHPMRDDPRLDLSGKLLAVLCCLLKETDAPWTNPAIAELTLTSDGFLLARAAGDIGHNDIVGPVDDLVSNIRGAADAIKATDGEVRWLLKKIRELAPAGQVVA